MSIELASFLAPGSLVGTVTQRVFEFLSVQDLIEHIASASVSRDQPTEAPKVDSGHHSPSVGDSKQCIETEKRERPSYVTGGSTKDPRESVIRQRDVHPTIEEIPTGGGDEAGGGTRALVPPWATPHQTTVVSRRCVIADGSREVVHPGVSKEYTLDEKEVDDESKKKHDGTNLVEILMGLGKHPMAALEAIGGGVHHLLRGIPLLALLEWAARGASSVLGVTFRVVLLPYDLTQGAWSYVVRTLEAILDVATEIWCELRHLSLGELACVVSCVVSGNSMPECLMVPLGAADARRGNGDIADGAAGTAGGMSRGHGSDSRWMLPNRMSSGVSLGSEDEFGYPAAADASGARSEVSREGTRMGTATAGGERAAVRSYSGRSRCSNESIGGSSGGRSAWRHAHALRRRLDRINRTASLVSYEECAENAVTRAKAERVRRRMHYAMSLQGFQATVTTEGQGSPMANDGLGEDGSAGGDSRGGMSSADPFMCTPQSFPPTPVSRAHVMARASRFADDILFLARDQLRLRENLKPGVDETTRATAVFLRRQQRLAVLDGNNAGDGIVLSCGHHCATKVGYSLYSTVRAMVPVLRNRYVYFQVSCKRDGALPPCIGVGLSTPEMPLSTLVGAFSNSVGLCSTGQILMSSRWYGSPGDYAMKKEGVSTVGVLVYLDGSRSFRSWDGEMVRAHVCFSVDGRLAKVFARPDPAVSGASVDAAHGVPSRNPTACLTDAAVSNKVVGQDLPVEAGPTAEEMAPWESAAKGASGIGLDTPALPIEESSGRGQAGANVSAPPPSPVSGQIAREFGSANGGATTRGAPKMHNGTAHSDPGVSAVLGLALPKDRDLFPTVTIHSPNTEVKVPDVRESRSRVVRLDDYTTAASTSSLMARLYPASRGRAVATTG